jgi:hypothetical protein
LQGVQPAAAERLLSLGEPACCCRELSQLPPIRQLAAAKAKGGSLLKAFG